MTGRVPSIRLRDQPSFCPLCGTDFQRHAHLDAHLATHHGLTGRTRLRVLSVAWREVSCALLGLTPEWVGP